MIPKSVIASVLVGLGLIFSLSQTAFAEEYVNEEFGYSVTAPSNWGVSTMHDPVFGEVGMFTQNYAYQGEFPPYFAIVRTVDERISYDPNYNLENAKKGIEAGFVSGYLNSDEFLGYNIVGTEVSEFEDGWRVVMRGNLLIDDGADGLATSFATIMLILKSDEMYLFWLYASPEDYDAAITKLMESYQTFRYEMNLQEELVGPSDTSLFLGENGLVHYYDPDKGPTHYINRYYSEPAYKDWFDKNYPGLTIEEAVGHNPSESEMKLVYDSELDAYVVEYVPKQNTFEADAPTDSEFVAAGQGEVDDFGFFDNPFYWAGWYGAKFLIYGVPLVVAIFLIKKFMSRRKKDSKPKEMEPSTLDNYV